MIGILVAGSERRWYQAGRSAGRIGDGQFFSSSASYFFSFYVERDEIPGRETDFSSCFRMPDVEDLRQWNHFHICTVGAPGGHTFRLRNDDFAFGHDPWQYQKPDKKQPPQKTNNNKKKGNNVEVKAAFILTRLKRVLRLFHLFKKVNPALMQFGNGTDGR